MKSCHSRNVTFALAALVALAGLLIPAWAQDADPQAAAAAKQVVEARAKLLGAIPLSQAGAFESKQNDQGDYVYEAASAKAMLEGASPGKPVNFKLEKDYSGVKGLDVATINQHPVPLGVYGHDGMYWRLGDIKAGKYFVGLVYRSDNILGGQANGVTEATATFTTLYLNGRVIQSSTLSDPVQIAPGVWFAEQQSASAESLKPGDEITVTPYAGGRLTAARLVLHAKEPARGAFRTFTNFGGMYAWPYTALRVTCQCDFIDAKGNPVPPENPWWGQQQVAKSPAEFMRDSSGKAVATCQITNPLSVPVTVEYQSTIRSHFLKQVGQDSATITLRPHQRVDRRVSFDLIDDEPAYSMHATVKVVNPPDLGWPEGDTVSYFPGVRQTVPWPDPFNNKYHRRVLFQDPVKGQRQTCSLNGEWEVGYTPELSPPVPAPADVKFAKVNVPFNSGRVKVDKMTPRPHAAYYRRAFDIPAEVAAGSCRMVIASVTSAATVYVNGKNVGGLKGENTPVVVDVTGSLKAGANEVVVVVQDLLTIMNPQYVNPKNPVISNLYLDVPGLFGSDQIGMEDVWLETSPALCAQDILVLPSYQKKTLGATLNVANRTGKAAKVVVKAAVSDGQKEVFQLGQEELTLKAGAAEPVKFGRKWTDAHLYSPQDPFLYVLAVTVTDKETGKTLDFARERFGFRECWIEGADIYYNGHKAKFKGSTGANALGIDADFQLNRGSGTATHYMDEVGMPCSEAVTGVYNTPSKHNVERDAYWQNAEKNMLQSARRLMNHPCIIAWDLSNEWYCFLPYCGADMKKGARRLEELTTAIRKLDPTRWTWYDGDGDLGGLHDNYSGHYITWAVQPPIAGYNMDGHTPVLPDAGFWRPLDRDFVPGQKIRFSTFYEDDFFIRYGEKVIMNTENLWKVGHLMPPGPSKLVGDEDVISPAMDQSGPMAWFWKNNLDGHRDMGTSSVSSYMLQGATNRGYMLQTFIMPGTVHHGFAGHSITRRYAVLNDRYAPADLTLVWSLLGPDGKSVAGGKDPRRLGPCDLQRSSLSFKLPDVQGRTTYVLDLRLENNGKLVYGEQQDIEVWPDNPSVAGANTDKTVFLFDPKGKTAEVFSRAGVKFQAVKSLAELERINHTRSAMLIVVGEQALDETNAATIAKLDSLAAEGARVLVLAQKVSPVGLPAATKIDPREWSSMPFVRTANHPILEGVTSWDLHFWSPDRVSARGAYNKPDGGPAVALIDSGTDIGMEWVQMMELYRGKPNGSQSGGNYILCQLPLVGNFDSEPMARELLGRTLKYLGGGEMFLVPAAKFQALTNSDSLVHNALRGGQVAFDLAKPDAAFDAKSAVLVDAAAFVEKPTDAQVAAWSQAMQAGATFVISCPSMADAAWLSKLAGKEVKITVPTYFQWGGRGYRVGYDKLTAGLSHCDFYYKRYDGTEPAGGQADDPSLTIEPFQDYSVAVAQPPSAGGDTAAGGCATKTQPGAAVPLVRELVFPGALVELKVGSGRLIVDARRWMTGNDRLSRYAQRQLASLAMGLGVQIAPVVAPRELPREITYNPIDLTGFANRSLVDDVADDGKGGWSDQGKEADLRTFPTGKQLFGGVPFNIDKVKSCIALASTGRPGFKNMPREVTIPLGMKVEGLYFLHSAAYSGNNLTGLYQIEYADGSTFDIPLRGEENIRDWASQPGPLLREKGTQSIVAWSGKCGMFPVISVYRMLWVNPKPDQPIKAVRFSNPLLEPVPILVAMTAALAKGQSADAAKTLAEIRSLLAGAEKLVAAGKEKDAIEAARKAVAIDPTFTTAQQALADLLEKAGDEEAVLAAYQAWVQAGAKTPLPHNRIGEILEKRKDYKGALEAYTRSLKVEWNQPPTITAKKRMEEMVAGK